MSCYGHNILGSRWADDDDDEWDPQASTATANNVEYHASTPVGASAAYSLEYSLTTAANVDCHNSAPMDASISDADIQVEAGCDGNDSGYASSTTSASTLCNEEDDLPARPSTPEPTTENTHSTGDDEAGEYHSSENDTTERGSINWAPLLRVPYDDDIHPGFHPMTPYWLAKGKPSTDAFPEVRWQFSGYSSGWHHLKRYHGLKDGVPLFSSPLRNGFTPDEAESDTAEDLLDLETELSLAQDDETDWDSLESEIEGLEAIISEECSKAVALSSGSACQDSEMKTFSPSHARNRIMDTLKLTCEDELASESVAEDYIESAAQQATLENLPPSKDEDLVARGKHDSVHEKNDDIVPGLFDEDEQPLSPVSSVVTSTDEEVDTVKKLPLVLPAKDQNNISNCTAD